MHLIFDFNFLETKPLIVNKSLSTNNVAEGYLFLSGLPVGYEYVA